MKGRLTAALAAVLLLGTGIAVAVGSLNDNALVSRSYYEDVYLPTLSQGLRQRAEAGFSAVGQKAEEKLKTLNGTHMETARSLQREGGAYLSAQLEAGDDLELAAGSSVLLQDGGGRLLAGALADVTDGDGVAAGESLTPAHRYIVTSDAGATLRQTLPGSLVYQGEGETRRGAGLALPFVDVPEDRWYHSAVAFVYSRGYFSGTGADVFSPDAPMDRAMVATVLHRVSGGEAVAAAPTFTDVPAGQWYSDGVAWASANGIVNGMGGELYAPHQPVTREQLVTMLYRYEKEYRKAATPGGGELGAFPDGGAVSAWAQDAMSWAVGAGLLQGRNNGYLDPAGTATRAEVATILQRFSQRLS